MNWIWISMFSLVASLANAAAHEHVVPIDWQRFERHGHADDRFVRCASLVQNSARYNMGWLPRTLALNEARDAYVLEAMDESGIRPACSVIYMMAALIETGGLDERIVGISEAEAKSRVMRLVRGVVQSHRSNTDDAKRWGDSWQSALWTSLCGFGGWMMWDDLDGRTQQALAAMVACEADRFLDVDYRVPYWNGQGGDSKAEENSWNSMVLSLATAMMPDHPHAAAWRERGNELLISSYATKRDWQSNDRLVAGRRVKDWLKGYNTEPGAVVVNHDRVHPDYMAAIAMNFWALTTQALVGRPALEGWDFNGRTVYHTFLTKRWPSPPYQQPGGTIYAAGGANVYYPMGSDWSRHDPSAYYLMDVYASIFAWHDEAADWASLRADAMRRMQQRHPDRRMFARGEYDTYAGSEQWVAWCLTDAYLPLWLDARDALKTKNQSKSPGGPACSAAE